jgi:hypothetical protein
VEQVFAKYPKSDNAPALDLPTRVDKKIDHNCRNIAIPLG